MQQSVLRVHGAAGAETGSPREIFQLGYKLGFVDDSAVWLTMLKKKLEEAGSDWG
ncbi:MAG: hypothetical protein HFI53_03455 [Lachnospiraceae bacterium]|nr:hypothetical protein [Lachnospiraceae bacterium]